MAEDSRPRLRRSWLSGYRVADVEVLRARLELAIAHLTQTLEASRARLAESEAEREQLATELARAEAAREETAARVQARSEELVEAARLDAARIRAAAALEEQEARARVDELLRLRDTLATTIRAVTGDFERVMAGVDEPEPIPPPIPPPPPPPPPPPTARTVELEAGPFHDFASLSAFEDALGSLSKVEDVYVRRFEGDRATIEVTLGEEPTALLDEMTTRLPYTLSVDRADADRIAVHVVGA
jgi:hypothetical protein